MKKIIGVTGPSIFSPEVKTMVEEYFGAICLYINQDKSEDLDYVLGLVDGVCLAGGVDWCPLSRNEDITTGDGFTKFDLPRDLREQYLINKCFEKNIPILGICRGHQGLGLYHDLYLMNDISGYDVCHSPKPNGIELNELPCHSINIFKQFQGEFFERDFFSSFHHQALYLDLNKLNNYKQNGVEVLGYSFLQYKTSKKEAEVIIELMRGTKNRWISCQNHVETEWQKNENSRKILNEFKKMLEKE